MNHHKIISARRAELGPRLAILAHHYQSDDIVRHADVVGDSLELARRIPELTAEHIVFCGVWFMAETAAILCRPDQTIHIPDRTASCALADMARAEDVARVISGLTAGFTDGPSAPTLAPVAYVNTSAAVKAVVGAAGGSVCTSANAGTMLRWALDRADAALFLPDRNLARNTARSLDIPASAVARVDLTRPEPRPGITVYTWPGICPVHDVYLRSDLHRLRAAHPGARIVVHPEAPADVVEAADGAGSTSYLITEAERAPEGATLVVGTEASLVDRLAARWAGRKTLLHLRTGRCDDMAKITEAKLAALLTNLEADPPVTVDPAVKEPARLALTRMLQASR
ncbi:MAG: quinolinate synthase NadA [Desulfovibrionaceae bacterium]